MVLLYLFRQEKKKQNWKEEEKTMGQFCENIGTKWTGFIGQRTSIIRQQTGFIRWAAEASPLADEATPPADEASPPENKASRIGPYTFSYCSLFSNIFLFV